MNKNREHAGELPYERFLERGPESLSNAELLAIIIRTGTKGKSALDLAREILSLNGEGGEKISSLYRLSMKDLFGIGGIGEVKAVKLLCILELSKRLSKERAVKEACPRFSGESSIAEYYMEEMRRYSVEVVKLLLFDSRRRLIRDMVISRGTALQALLSPREIYAAALREGAVSVCLLHNHPSGDPTPSADDIGITKRIAAAGKEMDVPLEDHIIIGDGRYISMKRTGYL